MIRSISASFPENSKRTALVGVLALLCLHMSSLPAASSTTITKATAEKVCLDPTNDLHLDAYLFYGGYLFCSNSDMYTGGQLLYKQQSNGAFVPAALIGGVPRAGLGGGYSVDDMVKYAHVPQATASYLVSTMYQMLYTLEHPTPTPAPPTPTPRPTPTPPPIVCPTGPPTPAPSPSGRVHPTQNPCA